MSYDADDYDDVYETTDSAERARLIRNGWVILETRRERIESKKESSFLGQWFRTASTAGKRGRVSRGVFTGVSGASANTRRDSEPEEVGTTVTYVLGWPRGQHTIGEAAHNEGCAEATGNALADDPNTEAAAADAPEAPSPPSTPGNPEGF